MRRTGSVAVVLSLLFLTTAAHAQSRRTSLTSSGTSRSGNYSLLGADTVPTGVDIASGEFGYPGVSFGLTHGTSPTSDIGVRFDILYGASGNEASWWDNSRARQLGYRPTGKAEDHRAHAEAEQAKIGPDPVGDLFQGGTFCSAEFTNDVKRAGP